MSTLIVGIFAGIAAVAQDIYQYEKGNNSLIGEIIEKTKAWKGPLGYIRGVFGGIFSVVESIGKLIAAIATGNMTFVVEAGKGFAKSLLDAMGSLFGIKSLTESIKDIATAIADKFRAIVGYAASVRGKASGLGETILHAPKRLYDSTLGKLFGGTQHNEQNVTNNVTVNAANNPSSVAQRVMQSIQHPPLSAVGMPNSEVAP